MNPPEDMKTVIIYKSFPSGSAAAAEGYTIPGVATRGGQKYGRMTYIPKKRTTMRQEVDDLVTLFGTMGMSSSQAQTSAATITANPQQTIIQSVPVETSEGSVTIVDEDALIAAFSGMGMSGRGRRRKTHKTHAKTKKTHYKRRHTRRN
jgi:hypothetical protein